MIEPKQSWPSPVSGIKTMTKDELQQTLKDHKNWLNNDGGKKADLRWANLRWANLRGADLREADLREADLHRADLRWADLRWADLRWADLRWANFRWVDLRWADLRGADLLTFQYQRDQAYCTGERLIIGCLDKPLAEWASDFEAIGKQHNYTDLQIKMYGKFIEMCVEHAATIERD